MNAKNYTENVVAAGVALDEHFGDKLWRDRINTKTLNLRCMENCILGQLFEEYGNAPFTIRQNHTAAFCGPFNLDFEHAYAVHFRGYKTAWLKYLA